MNWEKFKVSTHIIFSNIFTSTINQKRREEIQQNEEDMNEVLKVID